VLPALAIALLLAAPAAAGTEPPLRVLATGDSLIQPLDEKLGKPVTKAGGRVRRDPRPGTGITKPLTLDWEKHAKRQAKRHRPRATVMFLGANDSQALRSADGPRVTCCRRAWIDAYAERVADMMRSYMRGSRGYVYWLTLPTPRQEERRPLFAAVNFAIAQAAEDAGGNARVVDTVPALSPGGRFKRKLRYRGKRVVVRDRDGIHLTGAGAAIARDLVVRAMRADGLL
jgi:hypothetical protein